MLKYLSKAKWAASATLHPIRGLAKTGMKSVV